MHIRHFANDRWPAQVTKCSNPFPGSGAKKHIQEIPHSNVLHGSHDAEQRDTDILIKQHGLHDFVNKVARKS